MADKQNKILEAATLAFSRYGVRRTSMADIAAEAGISRQTLYASYPNKDEVLAAVIIKFTEEIVADITEAWENTTSFSEKLDIYFKRSILDVFDKIQEMPDSRDLIVAVSERANEVNRQAERQKAELLETLLVPFEVTLTKAGSSAKAMSEFVEGASRNFKYTADNREQLERLLSTLKVSVLATLQIQ